MVFIFVLVVLAFMVMHQPDGAQLGEHHIVKRTVCFLQDTRHGEGRFVLLADGMAGIDLIPDGQAAELCDIGAQHHLEFPVRRKHFALRDFLPGQVVRCGAHQAVAVVAVRHGKGDHGRHAHVLLQFRHHGIRDGAQRFIRKVHGVHRQLGLAAGGTDNCGIVSRVGGDSVAHLAGNVIGQDADACGNHNGKDHQQQLGLFDRHILQCETEHQAFLPSASSACGASYMPLVTAFISITWSK